MLYFANRHADFVGDEQQDAETENGPADDSGVAQPFHAVFFEQKSDNDSGNRRNNNQPE